MSKDIKPRSRRERELLEDKRDALYYATSSVMGEVPVLMEEMANSMKDVKGKMNAVNGLLRAISQQYVQPEKNQNTKS